MRNQIRNCEGSRQLTVTLSSHAHVVLQNLHDGEATEKEQCKKSVAQLDEPEKVRGVQLLLSSHREQQPLLRVRKSNGVKRKLKKSE